MERAYSVREACEHLGHISRSQFYAEIRAGRLRVRKLGKRTVVLQSDIDRYLRALPSANGD